MIGIGVPNHIMFEVERTWQTGSYNHFWASSYEGSTGLLFYRCPNTIGKDEVYSLVYVTYSSKYGCGGIFFHE